MFHSGPVMRWWAISQQTLAAATVSLFLVLLLSACSPFDETATTSPDADPQPLKIALLHLNPKLGELDSNLALVEAGIHQAAKLGAQWIVTPELSLTGYRFDKAIGIDWIADGPDQRVRQLQQLADRLDITLFLSHLEKSGSGSQDPQQADSYNTLFVIDPQGEIIARHRKINTIPVSEAWSTPGTLATVAKIGSLKVGLLICADAWPQKHARALQQQGADLIISSANWPPGQYGPKDVWELRSKETGLPLFINNRTGIEGTFDMRKAQSVVAFNGQRLLQHASEDSSLVLVEWNIQQQQLVSSATYEIVVADDSYNVGH